MCRRVFWVVLEVFNYNLIICIYMNAVPDIYPCYPSQKPREVKSGHLGGGGGGGG